jgi:hypothetical protein
MTAGNPTAATAAASEASPSTAANGATVQPSSRTNVFSSMRSCVMRNTSPFGRTSRPCASSARTDSSGMFSNSYVTTSARAPSSPIARRSS